jgi:uncharacterized protein
MVRRIVTRFSPEKVILFGSRARGNARPGSDVDLLVVMPVNGSRRKKMVEILTALHDFPLPVDVIVVTHQEFIDHADIVGTMVYPAVREGKVLYA